MEKRETFLFCQISHLFDLWAVGRPCLLYFVISIQIQIQTKHFNGSFECIIVKLRDRRCCVLRVGSMFDAFRES